MPFITQLRIQQLPDERPSKVIKASHMSFPKTDNAYSKKKVTFCERLETLKGFCCKVLHVVLPEHQRWPVKRITILKNFRLCILKNRLVLKAIGSWNSLVLFNILVFFKALGHLNPMFFFSFHFQNKITKNYLKISVNESTYL